MKVTSFFCNALLFLRKVTPIVGFISGVVQAVEHMLTILGPEWLFAVSMARQAIVLARYALIRLIHRFPFRTNGQTTKFHIGSSRAVGTAGPPVG